MSARAIVLVPTLTALLLVLLIASCVPVTVNITFPQEKIDNAASSIENLVRTPKEPPAPPSPPPQPAPGKEGGLPSTPRWARWFTPTVAEAQVPELQTRTPEIMAMIESRRARFPELSSAIASGCIGENTQGLVEQRPGAPCPSNVLSLVAGENQDRMTLYRTLVEQNHMPAADIARVQAAFAKVNRQNAPPGAWIQDDNGQWRRK